MITQPTERETERFHKVLDSKDAGMCPACNMQTNWHSLHWRREFNKEHDGPAMITVINVVCTRCGQDLTRAETNASWINSWSEVLDVLEAA